MMGLITFIQIDEWFNLIYPEQLVELISVVRGIKKPCHKLKFRKNATICIRIYG